MVYPDEQHLDRVLAPDAQDLERNYQTFCDPRLNYRQALEMALRVGSWMSAANKRSPARALPPAPGAR